MECLSGDGLQSSGVYRKIFFNGGAPFFRTLNLISSTKHTMNILVKTSKKQTKKKRGQK